MFFLQSYNKIESQIDINNKYRFMQKVLIADDHPIYRSGIRSVLESMPDVSIIGEASDGMEAYQLIISSLPDIAILDIQMPLLSGLDVCRKVLNEKNNTKFILLTMHREKHFFADAMDNGVDGYLLKDSAGQELITCIKHINNGKKYVSHNIESYLTEHLAHSGSTILQNIKTLLTPTEKVILKLIAEGKTSSEIASLLFVSANTVENHRANINKKLQLDGGKNALLKFAMEHKLYL
jgi:DNA-binding NarL/FixJ family response regulator